MFLVKSLSWILAIQAAPSATNLDNSLQSSYNRNGSVAETAHADEGDSGRASARPDCERGRAVTIEMDPSRRQRTQTKATAEEQALDQIARERSIDRSAPPPPVPRLMKLDGGWRKPPTPKAPQDPQSRGIESTYTPSCYQTTAFRVTWDEGGWVWAGGLEGRRRGRRVNDRHSPHAASLRERLENVPCSRAARFVSLASRAPTRSHRDC
ncbi:hypothetical protein RR48_12827 [Papilio machaon]|uniref:Uncharacterized protein n=1 Tax=Papilio machaon TaxID=76193 RepID=A0A194QSM6_PAPMA|nr:hypothetical protein RR48_12827 [Papilio machaon]